MDKVTRSIGYTFLFCCDLKSQGTKAHIHNIAFESQSHGNTYVSRKPCFVVD